MLLIFDCDGVIVDSMVLHAEVEASVYRQVGITIPPVELKRRFAGVPLNEEFRILEKETGLTIPPGAEEEMERRKIPVFEEKLKVVPGIREALDALRDVPCCVASSARREGLAHVLNVVGLYDRFAPHVFSTDMVVHGKPAPDLFLYAALKVGVLPSDCVVIEDGAAGVQAGIAAGMRVFGFTGGCHCEPGDNGLLKAAGAELVFSDMRELPEFVCHARRGHGPR